MLPNSWENSLSHLLQTLRQKKQCPELRTAVVGIGHELRSDDAAGIAIAEQLQPLAKSSLLVIKAGSAPENYTGLIRRYAPDLVLLVDAAQLGEIPGSVRWLPWQETAGLSASTHTLPLYLLSRFLTNELGCEVALIGIQPAELGVGKGLTQAVETAVHHTAAALKALLS